MRAHFRRKYRLSEVCDENKTLNVSYYSVANFKVQIKKNMAIAKNLYSHSNPYNCTNVLDCIYYYSVTEACHTVNPNFFR